MSSNIPLKKEVYEAKKARDLLDEEFLEFSPIRRNIQEFFEIYNNKFYSILNTTHQYFIENSLNYIRDYDNPKSITVQNLQTQIQNIQVDIDNTERFHPIIPNNTVIAFRFLPPQVLTDRHLYLIQSGKKRKIIGEEKEIIYNLIKSQKGAQNKLDEDFILELPFQAILSIESTKDIKNIEDLNDSFFTLNTYNGPVSDLFIN